MVPPVGELIFDDPPGDTHIKYGYIRNDAYYVIKIASGFYDNPKLGLSATNGLMLLFSQRTGELVSILLDEGHLTNIRTAAAGAVAANCNLIITATPSKNPLLQLDQMMPGTHVTAMGADTSEKNELDPMIISNEDIVIADSIAQCVERKEIHQAIKKQLLDPANLIELGNVISGDAPRRTSDDQRTVVDLTGVAVQDIQITKAVFEALTAGDSGT